MRTYTHVFRERYRHRHGGQKAIKILALDERMSRDMY